MNKYIKENLKKLREEKTTYDQMIDYCCDNLLEGDLTRKIPVFESFRSWCYGLPSLLETGDYVLGNGIKVLGDILEETEEERNSFGESEAEEKLTYLIFREIF